MSNQLNNAVMEPRLQDSESEQSRIGFGVWSWIAASLVVYGSLIPFNFHIPNIQSRIETVARSFNPRNTQIDDVFINVLLYFPLGALFALARRRCSTRVFPILQSILLAGMISTCVETLQIFLPSRVPSILDVILNVSGAMIGAFAVNLCAARWDRMMGRVIAEFDRRPSQVLAIAMTCAILVQAALPFDFISTTSALHEVFRHASQLSLDSPEFAGIPSSTKMISNIAFAGWFALLGFLAAQSEERTHPGLSILIVVGRAAVLVFLMETIGLFRNSHLFDTGSIFLRILASAFGAWCAVFVWNADRSIRLARRSAHVPLGWLVISACVLILTIVGNHSWGTNSAITHTKMAGFEIRMPFEALWRASTATCASTLINNLMVYAALSSITISILRRLEISRPQLWTFVFNVAIAMAQNLHSLSLHQVFDFTMPIVAGLIALSISHCSPVFVRNTPRTDHASNGINFG